MSRFFCRGSVIIKGRKVIEILIFPAVCSKLLNVMRMDYDLMTFTRFSHGLCQGYS